MQHDMVPEAVKRIIQEEAERYDTSEVELLSGCRRPHVVRARRAVILRLRGRLSQPSYNTIGAWLGCHFSTVRDHVKGVKEERL